MTYYTPQTTRTAGIRRPTTIPIRIAAPSGSRLPARASSVARLRVQNGGTDLGILPALAAAAIPSVKNLAGKALTSVIGILDPGKKREANRKARAQMWGDLARAGSITAARRVLGGQTMQYTKEEKAYYVEQWNSLVKAEPNLAAQARTLGGLGIPDPGSDQAPPQLSEEDLSALQREVDEYRNPSSVLSTSSTNPTTTTTTTTAPKLLQSSGGMFLALGLVGAYLVSKRR